MSKHADSNRDRNNAQNKIKAQRRLAQQHRAEITRLNALVAR